MRERDEYREFYFRRTPKLVKMIGWGILGVVALIIIASAWPFVIVGAGERGVVLRWGAVTDKVLDEGLHFRIPIYERVILVDVKTQKSETDAAAASRDLQGVRSTIAVNYHVIPTDVNRLYQRVGLAYKERIIDPAVQEVFKAVTAAYAAEALITKRDEVSAKAKEELATRLARNHIALDDFYIVDFNFSEEFNKAIEAKQTAEQLALKAKRDLERIKIEAEQRLTQARAESEAQRILRQNISPEVLQLRAIEKWDGKLPMATGAALPFVQVPAGGVGR